MSFPLLLADSAVQGGFDQGRILVLGIILALVAALMLGIRFLGLALAASHPEETAQASPTAIPPETTPELIAIVAAAAASTLGPEHKIVSIAPARGPSVESLMQQWSFEGRRAIYSSHSVR